MGAQEKAEQASQQAEKTGRSVQQNPVYRWLVTVGLAAYGVVHLLVAWLALQLAFGGGSGEASNTGALQELSDQPFGGALLIVVAVGLGTLSIWQLLDAAFGHRDRDGADRIRKRLTSVAKAVLYAGLGVSAMTIALGGGGGGGDTEQSVTGRLLSNPAGVVLVLAVAAGVAAVGIAQIVKGVRKKFTEDLAGSPGRAGTVLGVLGHVAKGVAFLVVASLFAAAAITHDPERTGGMDTALRAVRDQPFGVFLLALMAFGLACYGLYCFVWARSPKHA